MESYRNKRKKNPRKKLARKLSLLTSPCGEENEDGDRSHPTGHAQSHLEHHVPQHFRQLRMRQTQGPQPKVRGGVGNARQTILDGVNRLSDHHLQGKTVKNDKRFSN